MEFIIIFLITIIVAFFILKKRKFRIKDSEQKKEEIINAYENNLRSIIEKNKHNQSKLLQEKKLFLLKCNSELSRNIFFTAEESKKIIENLLKL
jgi:uncharacterized membrane protein (DUF106 family)